jgi:hypothetical protein
MRVCLGVLDWRKGNWSNLHARAVLTKPVGGNRNKGTWMLLQ